MVVTLEKFNDAETFDQNKQKKATITGLYFKGKDGVLLYKPAVLNRTNAKFFVKETGSDFMEDWLGRTVVMYAQKDSRFGHVVRFKTFHLPSLVIGTERFNELKAAYKADPKNLDLIKKKYQVSKEVEEALTK